MAAFFALMVVFFTIICGISFSHHFKISDITFYYHTLIFTGTIQVYGSGLHFSFKPSAFESEIHPLYKLRLCNGDFALAGGSKSR